MRAFWRCPPPPVGWDYDAVKNPIRRAARLSKRCERLLIKMSGPGFPHLAYVYDSRPIHRRMFRWMTPICFQSFAGNYRGDERYRCLKTYRVTIGNVTNVAQPENVLKELAAFTDSTKRLVQSIESAPNFDPDDRLWAVIVAVCFVLAEFMRIHPYANGNGHMGRFMVWSFLLKFGYVPRDWPLEERPPEPYIQCLDRWRAGEPVPLQLFLLQCIKG